MIKKLKLKFVLLSMASLFALLVILIAGMNVINFFSVVNEADETLSLLSQNKGAFPDFQRGPGERGDRLPPEFSPELPYESRYFSVLLTGSGELIHTEMSRIISVDGETAIDYANDVMNSSADRGFVGDFRFVRTAEGEAIRITFLDCGRKLDAYFGFLITSITIAAAGFGVVFLVIFFLAGRIIRPIAESHEKQKRFITDAGHEIKTPLTIINANVDVLAMDLEQNECLEDIRQQTKRLTALTNDLVYLARMEESGGDMPMIEFPVSEIVSETALPFQTLAQTQGKTVTCHVEPMLSLRGNDKAIRQLVNILMDNALKYSPSGGEIALTFMKQARSLCLTVSNTTETAVSPEDLPHVFDRFYRTDKSRNSETGGHGIGLSVAKAIVTAHGGKIHAAIRDGDHFQIVVGLPI